MDGTARDDLRSDTAVGEDTASLVEAALQLRWRAPELALLLVDRAAAPGSGMAGTADLLAAASLNRLGREVEAGQRALAALRCAGPYASEPDASEPELARQLRVELAVGAVAVGAAGAALAVLRPVLQAGPGIRPAVRATALVQLAAALTELERDDGAALALEEADELYRHDADLEAIPAVLLRGTVRALRSSQHRRRGELAAAEAAARDGLELLSELSSPADDGCGIGARLVLELVLTLLDRGELRAAARAADPVVSSSVRAAAAPARGWLHLALATRMHQPGGRHREALALLGDAIDAAGRHLLDPVLAGCFDGQSRIHEERGELAEALQCLRSAHAAEYRHRRVSDALRIELIEEFGAPRRDVAGLADQLTDLVGTPSARHRPPRHGGDRAASAAVPDPAEAVGAAAVGTEAAVGAAAAVDTEAAVGVRLAEIAEPVHHDPEPEADSGRARHRRDGRERFPVAELLLAAGRSSRGDPERRRAANRPEAAPDDAAAVPDDAAVPEHVAPEHVAPEHVAPEHVAPEHVAPEHAAPEHAAPEHAAPEHAAPEHAAPEHAAPEHETAGPDVILPLGTAAGSAVSAEPGRTGQAAPPTLISKLPLDEIGLGDLLAEALAAFEEGRRSRVTAAGAAGRPPTDGAARQPPAEPLAQVAGCGPERAEPAEPAELAGEQVWQPPDIRRHSAAGE